MTLIEPKKLSQFTSVLPPLDFPTPMSVAEMISSSPSPYGASRLSEYLSCPEKSRLRSIGVRKQGEGWVPLAEMNALQFGSFIHALFAYRAVAGHNSTQALLAKFVGELHGADLLETKSILETYELTFPEKTEPFSYLGVEVEVCSDFAIAVHAVPRTVKYDGIIKTIDGRLLGLERKTSARGGDGAIEVYMLQRAFQVAVWNMNPDLVRLYGKMQGVLMDVIVKTRVPRCERKEIYVHDLAQRRAIEWGRLTNEVRYPTNPDGSYPRFLHSCFGRFSPCEYIALCWDGAFNEYTQEPEGAK